MRQARRWARLAVTAAVRLMVGTAMLGAMAPGAALGQELTAEVRTWSGQTWRLGQPILERLSTVVLGDDEVPAERRRPLARLEMSLSSSGEIQPSPGKRRELRQARTPQDTITLRQGSTDVQVPVTGLAALVFTRQPIPSSLPPHVAPEHMRYAATAIMTDGSRIEGDYVNLGLTVLRGITREGRIEIPWNEIESIRFLR